MKKSMLYTRTGDRGMTALVGGERIAKNSVRVNAYGSVDELNAHIGLLSAYMKQLIGEDAEAGRLERIMSKMFCIGCYLATPSVRVEGEEIPAGIKEPDVSDADIAEIEEAIDRLDSIVPEQRTFILPGGCVAACHAHVARTVCRRAERDILDIETEGEFVHPLVTRYINRLSDYLFILARYLNHVEGVEDIPWSLKV